MGSAAALQGTVQSVVAGVAGWLVGMLGNSAALPVMGIITGFAILATVFLLTAHRWQPETHTVPQAFPDPHQRARITMRRLFEAYQYVLGRQPTHSDANFARVNCLRFLSR